MKKRAQKKAKKPVVWIEVPEIVVPDDLTIQDAAADLAIGVVETFEAQCELTRLGDDVGSMLFSGGSRNESGIIKLSDQYTELAAAAARASRGAWLFAGVVQRERQAGRISGGAGIGVRFSGIKLGPDERKPPTAADVRQTMRATTKRVRRKAKRPVYKSVDAAVVDGTLAGARKGTSR